MSNPKRVKLHDNVILYVIPNGEYALQLQESTNPAYQLVLSGEMSLDESNPQTPSIWIGDVRICTINTEYDKAWPLHYQFDGTVINAHTRKTRRLQSMIVNLLTRYHIDRAASTAEDELNDSQFIDVEELGEQTLVYDSFYGLSLQSARMPSADFGISGRVRLHIPSPHKTEVFVGTTRLGHLYLKDGKAAVFFDRSAIPNLPERVIFDLVKTQMYRIVNHHDAAPRPV